MDHLVRYRMADGQERYEDVADVHSALSRAEVLRNDEGVSDVRIYATVRVEFRPYYRAAVVNDAPPLVAAVPPPPAEEPAAVAPLAPVDAASSSPPPPGAMLLTPPPVPRLDDAPAPMEEEPKEAESGRRVSLFNRGQAS